MARRKARRKSPSKYKSAFNLRTAGKAVAQLSVGSKMAFNVGAKDFFFAGYAPQLSSLSRTGQGTERITLYELINWESGKAYNESLGSDYTAAEQIAKNIQGNIGEGILGFAGIKVADIALQKVGFYRSFNKLVRQAGFGNVVKM